MINSTEKEFEYLPLTIAIETLGGISTPLVLRGTPLPATRTQVFTTANDNQLSVEIHILMGESPVAKRNISVARFMLKDIPEMPRGEPQIQVTFQVNKNCRITASALEKSSSKKVEVNTEGTQPYLSDEKIAQLLEESEKTRENDEYTILPCSIIKCNNGQLIVVYLCSFIIVFEPGFSRFMGLPGFIFAASREFSKKS